MKLSMDINVDVSDTTPDVEELVLDIAMQEARKFSAALTDRLEQEGVKDIQISVNENEV